MGHDEQVQHGPEGYQHHQTAVRKNQQCSTCARHSGRLVPHVSRGPPGLPPLTLFNISLERMVTDALKEHHGTVSIEGRIITYLRFADDIDGLAGEKQ